MLSYSLLFLFIVILSLFNLS